VQVEDFLFLWIVVFGRLTRLEGGRKGHRFTSAKRGIDGEKRYTFSSYRVEGGCIEVSYSIQDLESDMRLYSFFEN
jgi:hypothetical protein